MSQTKPNKELQGLQKSIFSKERETDILDHYHCLMINYGYIPFEDFKKMDAHLVNELLARISETNKSMQNASRRN